MEDAFKLQSIEGYTKNFFVLTDGDIGNTLQVVELIKNNCGLGKGFVYSIGIGSGASEFLVEEISKAGKGQFVMISDEEDPKDKLGSLLSDSLSPRLTDFVVTFDKEYIKGLTPILNKDSSVSINQVHKMYALLNPSKDTGSTEVRVEYFDPVLKGRTERVFLIDLAAQGSSARTPFLMFTKQYLNFKANRLDDFFYIDQRLNSQAPEFDEDICLAYRVMEPGKTSFVALIKDIGGEEFKPLLVSREEKQDNF